MLLDFDGINGILLQMPMSLGEQAAAKFVRLELLKLDWSMDDLAAKTGLNRRNVKNVICSNNRFPGSRHKIEDALGVPIWSTPGEFAGRRNDFTTAQPTTPAVP